MPVARTGADVARLRRLALADKPAVPLDQLTMAVVGARFDNRRRKGQPTGNRQTEILLCEPGEPVELRLEPTNPADKNAIAAYSARGVQLGYLSADKTAIVHKAREEARLPRVIFQEATPWGCWIRVGLGVDPTLPVAPAEDRWRAAMPSDDLWDGVDYVPFDS